jgi:hypothetical protein
MISNTPIRRIATQRNIKLEEFENASCMLSKKAL